MRNIAEIVEEILTEKGKPENIQEIKKELIKKDIDYKKMDKDTLLGLIHTELSLYGRFIYIDGQWDLKSRYSSIELAKIKDEYMKNIDETEIDKLEEIEKEVENTEEIESLEGPDKVFEESDDDVTEIDELSIRD